jgi:hypothetical protein
MNSATCNLSEAQAFIRRVILGEASISNIHANSLSQPCLL